MVYQYIEVSISYPKAAGKKEDVVSLNDNISKHRSSELTILKTFTTYSHRTEFYDNFVYRKQ